MNYRYFTLYGLPGRVLFDGDMPDEGELYDPERNEVVRDNAIVLDLIDHLQAIEITEAEFKRLLRQEQERRQARPPGAEP